MKAQTINSIAQYMADATVYEYPDNEVIAEDIYRRIEPLIEIEAQKFAGWIANQVIGGRTYDVLWRDYQETKRSWTSLTT